MKLSKTQFELILQYTKYFLSYYYSLPISFHRRIEYIYFYSKCAKDTYRGNDETWHLDDRTFETWHFACSFPQYSKKHYILKFHANFSSFPTIWQKQITVERYSHEKYPNERNNGIFLIHLISPHFPFTNRALITRSIIIRNSDEINGC